MIENLQPYPARKDSGVPWLGEAPEHWDVRRIRSAAQVQNGSTPSSSNPEYWDGDIVWLTPEDLGRLRGRYIDGSGRRITRAGYKACGTTIAPTGSIALSTRAPIGHLGVLRVPACVNQGCRLLTPLPDVRSEYLYYQLLTARGELQAFGQGSTFTELSRSKLCSFPFLLPPLPEQAAIVRFLDHVDRRISRYIRAKQKLIKLLEEQKQAIIHRAVTRGLDLDVKLKPSGVEWLGDVPAHWEVRPVGRLGALFKGNGGNKNDEVSAGIPCVRYGDLYTRHEFFITTSKACVSNERAGAYTSIRHGDVLFAASGESIEDIGRSAVNLIEGEARCGGDVLVLRPEVSVVPRYLGYASDSPTSRHQKARMGRGFTVVHIYGGELKRLALPLPPLPEQAAIVTYLDEATASSERAIACAGREIDLLREYRSRLIADVVTGKLDVREAAARLPDEIEEPEPLDEIEAEGDTDEGDVDEVPEEAEA